MFSVFSGTHQLQRSSLVVASGHSALHHKFSPSSPAIMSNATTSSNDSLGSMFRRSISRKSSKDMNEDGTVQTTRSPSFFSRGKSSAKSAEDQNGDKKSYSISNILRIDSSKEKKNSSKKSTKSIPSKSTDPDSDSDAGFADARNGPEESSNSTATLTSTSEAETARLEAERLEAERVAPEAEAAHVEAEAARAEAERVAAEAEAARVEAERLETERLEADRVEAEHVAAGAESARVEAERVEAEHVAAEAEAAREEAERNGAEVQPSTESEGAEKAEATPESVEESPKAKENTIVAKVVSFSLGPVLAIKSASTTAADRVITVLKSMITTVQAVRLPSPLYLGSALGIASLATALAVFGLKKLRSV